MILLARELSFVFLACGAVEFCRRSVAAQNDAGETKGIDSGDYNIQQSIEAGYRTSLDQWEHRHLRHIRESRTGPSSIRLHAGYALAGPQRPAVRQSRASAILATAVIRTT